MKKRIFLLMFAVFSTAGLALPVWAAPNFLAGDKDQPVTISSPLADDTYIGADTAAINADIDGDLIIGAGRAEVNGLVGGDLWIGAGEVTVSRRVEGDVRIGGGRVTINAPVDDDVLVGTGELIIGDAAVIRGDLLVGSGSAVVGGRILGSARIAGGEVTLKGTINGNVEVRTDEGLTILPGTKIGGELSYWSPKEDPTFSQYAKRVIYHPMTKRSTLPMIGAFMWLVPALGISFLLWKLISVLLLGAVIIWLMPKLLPKAVALAKKDYWRALLAGLLVMIGGPVLMVVLVMTLVGGYLALVIGLLYGLVMVFGYATAAMMLGSWLLKKYDKTLGRQLWTLVVGSVLFGLIGIVPVVGWLVDCALMLIGIGGFWLDRYQLVRNGKY